MSHLLDTSALLAHHLAEAGADQVQALFDDEAKVIGLCVLTALEFEARLSTLGLGETERRAEYQKYATLVDEIVPITEAVCFEAIRLKLSASSRLPNIDCLIAAAAKSRGAILVHRDPHFIAIAATELAQLPLPPKSS